MNMDRAMVLFASPLPLDTPALDTEAGRQFPSEILLTMFENIQDPATLRHLRLVNSQFEELVTPIWCRQVVLTPGLVAQYGLNKAWSDHSMLQVHFTAHTQHVVIKKKLDWLLVKRLLSTLKNLQSLLWIEWPSANASDLASLLAFEEIRDQLPHINYQVESFTAVAWRITRLRNLPDIRCYKRQFSKNELFPGGYSLDQDVSPKYLPTAQFNSLKLVNWDEHTYSYAKPLLLGNAGLKTLHIAGNRKLTNIEEEDIGDEDCLPPIEELRLKNYKWDHSPSIVEGFWNWNNLTSLELEHVPVIRFCRTVSIDKLTQLKTFRTDGFCFDKSNWDQATELLSSLISNIRGLHELSLTCNVGYQYCVSSILRHSTTLHTLELRSYSDQRAKGLSDKLSQERVTMDQLNSIRTMCPHLTTLVFDLRPPLNDLGGLNLADENYVALLAEFRNLRRLTIFAWTGRCVEEDGNEPRMARHYRDARGWNERLASMKQGAKFEHIILKPEIWKLQSDRAEDASFAGELSVTHGKTSSGGKSDPPDPANENISNSSLSVLMLKLFSNNEKSSSSQSRSTTLPDWQSSSSDIEPPPVPTATVDGLQFDLMAPNPLTPQTLTQFRSSANTSVAEPSRSHQRVETEQVRINRDLPPLFTLPSQSTFHSTLEPSELEAAVQSNELTCSSQQSLHSSSARSKRLTIPLFSSEKTAQGKTEEKVGKLADWFRGESEPINIGFLPSPTKEKDENMETSGASSLIRPSTLLQRKSTTQGTSKPAIARRFSFFPSKTSLAKSTSTSPDLNDEFLDMDINKALFPSGPADPCSPAALKNLQQQAESLLSRIQSAYRERTLQVHEIAAEKEALAEEALGAETRAQHLKMQLNDMSTKFTEQDQAIMNLVDELAKEKLARREDEDARKRTLRLVEQSSPPHTSHGRVSAAYTISDSGFESEDESTAESLFSRGNGVHSPTMSMSSVSTSNSPDAYQFADGHQLPDTHISTSTSRAARLRIPNSHNHKGTSAPDRNDLPEETLPSTSSCTNCHGGRASEAWSVVGVLQEENRCLKHRVGELEGALDGCLDVVTRLG